MNSTAVPTMKDSTAGQPNFFAHLWRSIGHFLQEVMVELKKTDWPTRNELTKFTIVVMVTIIVVAIYLFFSDKVAQLIMQIALPTAVR
ncbi:MAG: preprotein translocase subunit SecE [Armatimonadota bacterium]